MSFLSGIMKSIINPATLMQLAMGPAGWASLAMRTIGMAIAQQVIQQIGQKLGLPPAIISMAQQAFSAAAGQPGAGVSTIAEAVSQFAQQTGLSPADAGNAERQSNVLLDKFVKDSLEGNGGEESPSALTGGKAESFLVAFAKALGKTMDSKMNRMMDVSKQIDKETQAANNSGGKKQAVIGELSSTLQGLGQELSFISQAAANSIKSIGEAASAMARKN